MAQETFAEVMQRFGKSLTSVGEMYAQIHIDPDIMKRLHVSIEQFEKRYWHQFRHESLREWGNRLQRHGLLDDPEIRAEYQVQVWAAMASPVTWLCRKVRRNG